jgi:hypothetical protein
MSLSAGVNALAPTVAVSVAVLAFQKDMPKVHRTVLTALLVVVAIGLIVMLLAALAKQARKTVVLPKDAYALVTILMSGISWPTLFVLGALNLKGPTKFGGIALMAAGAASALGFAMAAADQVSLIHRTPWQMKPKNVDRLYALIRRFQTFAQETELEFFVICGTLIGAARHGGLMQWDDDVDLGMLEEQAYRLTHDPAVLKALQRAGMSVSSCITCLKIYDNNYSYPFLDIFPFRKQKRVYEYANGSARFQWPKETIATADLKGPSGQFASLPYGPLRLPAPFNYIKVLQAQFGKDVMTHFYTQTTHGNSFLIVRRGIAPKKTLLEEHHRQPLLPSR